jgi:putative acetyltransferase
VDGRRRRLRIREDDLMGGEVAELLRAHLDEMHEITPPESVHALDLDALRSPAWEGDELLGCGALQELDPRSGEIKSMRTVEAHRGTGVASRILEHILDEARRRGYACLHLETGSMPEFEPARALYTRYGFEFRGPFAEYTDDPNSVFMMKKLV